MTAGMLAPKSDKADGKNPHETIKHYYNCDMNEREEFLPTSSLPIIDPALISQQRALEEIVARRDTAMAIKINETLHNASSKDRFFFAVGFCELIDGCGGVHGQDHPD